LPGASFWPQPASPTSSATALLAAMSVVKILRCMSRFLGGKV
jgi:hypothetical protein